MRFLLKLQSTSINLTVYLYIKPLWRIQITGFEISLSVKWWNFHEYQFSCVNAHANNLGINPVVSSLINGDPLSAPHPHITQHCQYLISACLNTSEPFQHQPHPIPLTPTPSLPVHTCYDAVRISSPETQKHPSPPVPCTPRHPVLT